jgi:hypothetical protein
MIKIFPASGLYGRGRHVAFFYDQKHVKLTITQPQLLCKKVKKKYDPLSLHMLPLCSAGRIHGMRPLGAVIIWFSD